MKRRDFIKTTSTGALGAITLNSAGKSLSLLADKPDKARFVWVTEQTHDRNVYGVFRRSFDLKKIPATAELKLFADTVYQLFVNGKFIEFGPVRFDPQFPQYDSHNLVPHLHEGRNAIVVLVNSFGQKTYKAMREQAGFLAWGEIREKDKTLIDFATGTSGWKATADPARTRYASKLSFALNSREIVDQQTDDYLAAEYNDVHWAAPKLVPQPAWGAATPRTIPFMSDEEIPIQKINHLLPLQSKEDVFSFSLPTPWYFEEESVSLYHRNVYFSTWLYSPKKQEITVGAFWGEYWLNNIRLPKGKANPVKSLRNEEVFNLNEGWNYFCGYVSVYYDIVNIYLGFPKSAGVKVFADKDFNSPYSFKHSGSILQKDFESKLSHLKAPFAADENLTALGGWQLVKHTEPAYDPCLEGCWDDFGNQFEHPSITQLNGLIIRKSLYPEGFNLLLELDYTRLAFPIVQLHGVNGATVDLAYSEMISDDKQHLRHEFNYTSADRIFCRQNTLQWQPIQPRGMKYLRLTVRNTTGDVAINQLQLRSASYPVSETGYLKCSDPLLTEIWQMGQRTQKTNMEDAYVDCVTRERGMYGRDTIIQYFVNLATFGDHKLMHRCFELYGQSPDGTGKFRAVYPNRGDYTIADFALNMSEGFKAYYDHTGDLSLLKQFWPQMVKNIGWFNALADEREDLLLDAEWNLKKGIAAHYGGFHGDLASGEDYASNKNIHCTFSATYLISLRCMSTMAKLVDAPEGNEYDRRIGILEQSIRKAFWNDNLGAFSDNIDFKTHSAHANILAARAMVPTPYQTERMRKFLYTDLSANFLNGYNPVQGSKFSPNFAFYIFDGLYLLGMDNLAQKLMREGWGWALAQGYRTTPEYFEYRPNNSYCHAWSASPTYYLSKSLLGITYPNAPNLDLVRIKLQTGDVTWAEGAFPHPKGKIEVKWHKAGEQIVFDYIKAPTGVVIETE